MIVNKKSETSRSGLYFIYRGSSNTEKKGYYGMAHLGEHMFCKVYEDIVDSMQKYGLVCNAYTSSDEIVFYFTGMEKYLSMFRSELIEKFKTGYKFTEEQLEKEKLIVLEEYMDNFTEQTSIFYQNHLRKEYNNYGPIGLKEDIIDITYNDFVEFYNKQYSKPDMIINISKDYVLENDFEIEFEDRSAITRNKSKFNNDAILEKVIEFEDKLCVLYEQEIDKSDIPYVFVLSSMMSSGLNSPLYQEIREKRNLTYSISNSNTKIGDKNINYIFVAISPDKLDQLTEGLETVFNDKSLLSRDRFDIIKTSKLIKFEESEIDRYKNIKDIIDPIAKKFIEVLPDMTYEEVMERYDKYYVLNQYKRFTDK